MTAGTRLPKRIWRAAPLPGWVRGSAVSCTVCAICYLVSVEQGTDGLVAVLVADRLGHEACDRQDLQLVEPPLLREPDRVGHRHFVDRRLAQALDRGSREQGVGREREHAPGA